MESLWLCSIINCLFSFGFRGCLFYRCAARGERNGWTGDATFGSESEMFDFGTGAFFSNYFAMVADSQGPNLLSKSRFRGFVFDSKFILYNFMYAFCF